MRFYDADRDDWATGWVVTKYIDIALSIFWAIVALVNLPDLAKGVLALATIGASYQLLINQMKLRTFLVDGESMLQEAC